MIGTNGLPAHSSGTIRRKPRVVIIGAGFGGLKAAEALRNAPVEVLIADRNNYHKFQPLLYQVATAGLDPEDIAHNVRDIFKQAENISFRLGTVEHIDVPEKLVRFRKGPPTTYDFLILAAGAVTSYFGIEGAAEHAFPLKNLPDAVALRNHVLRLLERLDRHPGTLPEGALNFVIVGGGPTGVEMAGALVELFDVTQREYRHLDTRRARVYLLEREPHLLPPYDPALRDYTRQVLESRGVHVLTGVTVARITEDAVHLAGGEHIPTHTLVWGAGITAHPLGTSIDAPQTRGGRIVTRPDLSLESHPEVFVVGDMNGMETPEGELYPQVAQVAMQQGTHAAHQILRRLQGDSPESFRYQDLGQMATIGRNAAVAEIGARLKFKGFTAWLLWALVHIYQLVGFRNRAQVFITWIYNYLTYDRSARLILDMVPLSDELPYEVEDVEALLRNRLGQLERDAAETKGPPRNLLLPAPSKPAS